MPPVLRFDGFFFQVSGTWCRVSGGQKAGKIESLFNKNECVHRTSHFVHKRITIITPFGNFAIWNLLFGILYNCESKSTIRHTTCCTAAADGLLFCKKQK